MDLYFLRYNNFFNRHIKKLNTLNAYLPYLIGDPLYNVDLWNPNDGIDTTITLGSANDLWTEDIPDYMLEVSGSTIIGRWFVLDADRTRYGQYTVSLRRDLIADNMEAVMNSKAYVEKGWLSNASTFIFNNEPVAFNQVKTQEVTIKNPLNCPWLVAYMSRGNAETGYNRFQGTYYDDIPTSYDYVLNSLSDYPYYYWSQQSAGYTSLYDDDLVFGTWYSYDGGTSQGDGQMLGLSRPKGWHNTGYGFSPSAGSFIGRPNLSANVEPYITNILNTFHSGDTTIGGLPSNSYTSIGTEAGVNILTRENGKRIKVGSNYYEVTVTVKLGEYSYSMGGTRYVSNSALADTIIAQFKTAQSGYLTGPSNRIATLRLPYNATRVELSFTPVASSRQVIKYDVDYSNGAVTVDAPYEVLMAPYGEVELRNGLQVYTQDPDRAMQWFQNLATNHSEACYDIQLVPYCPLDLSIASGGYVDLSSQKWAYASITNEDGSASTQDPQAVQAIAIKMPKSSFSLLLNSHSSIITRSDRKKSVNLDLYRLVSPNGVGEYEFSPAKNEGLNAFEIDCTLIPYTPYIKITPLFSGLYGKDFDDYRGLICGGDFSLPIVSSAWENYRNSNKYYQDIFNREIQSQEYNNDMQSTADKWSAGAGALGGMAGGAGAGALIGSAAGPVGTLVGGLVGGIVGGISSAIGGAKDVEIKQALREEAINKARDQFQLNLRTIQAKPNTLTRNTAYNVNNKYFPYLEYYTCTEEEEEAFEELLLWQGMTVGKIGTLKDYLNPSAEFTFIQASILDLNINDDWHMADAINNLIKGGVRIEYSE